MQVGRDYGVRDVGTLTQRSMRIERFIPFWAEELSSVTTPFEASNGYSVRLDKVNLFFESNNYTINFVLFSVERQFHRQTSFEETKRRRCYKTTDIVSIE